MNIISFKEVVTEALRKDAVERNDFFGFYEDYLVLHCLIKKYKPNTFIEIGTSSGSGTNVICKAMEGRKVFSLDVPPGTDSKIIYPSKEDGHPDKAGNDCSFPYTQLFGFSNKFNFAEYYPLEGWFIDGKHDYFYVSNDTMEALKAKAQLIIWHDMQIEQVSQAVTDHLSKEAAYNLFRVESTRMAYAIRK